MVLTGLLAGLAFLAVLTWRVNLLRNPNENPARALNAPDATYPAADTNTLEYQIAARLWQQGEYAGAFEWFKKAAEAGSVAARYELGKAYLYGRGTPQHFQLAAEQLLQAAQAGHPEAQYLLARMYQNGQGGPPDLVHAYMWLNVAAANGHPTAAFERDQLRVSLSAEEIQRAQQMSLEWLPAGEGH